MFFYIVFFLFFIILLHGDKLIKVRGLDYRFMAFFVIFIFSALRFDVGWDYMQYRDLIEGNVDFYRDQFNRLEYFNRLLFKISTFLGVTQIYFITTSLIIIFCIYNTFKKFSADFVIASLLFISLPIFFFNSLSIIRQFTAVAIIFYSFRYVVKRDLLRFVICICIAVLFHRSAVIALPLFFLYGRSVGPIFYIVLLVLGIFSSELLTFLIENFLPEYRRYIENDIGQGGDKILILFQCVAIGLLFFTPLIKNESKNLQFYMLNFYIGILIWSALSKYGHAGFRGSLYFTIFILLLIPELLKKIKQKKVVSQILYIVCFSFYVFTLYLGSINTKKDPNIPYRSVLFTDTTTFKD